MRIITLYEIARLNRAAADKYIITDSFARILGDTVFGPLTGYPIVHLERESQFVLHLVIVLHVDFLIGRILELHRACSVCFDE